MIREIEKPEIDFKFYIDDNDRFYYDEKNKEYFLKTKMGSRLYFNLKGNKHRINNPAEIWANGIKIWKENNKFNRIDGPAVIEKSNKVYYIDNIVYLASNFAKKTNHLICDICDIFCEQGCFF